jgi:hypothetical protein
LDTGGKERRHRRTAGAEARIVRFQVGIGYVGLGLGHGGSAMTRNSIARISEKELVSTDWHFWDFTLIIVCGAALAFLIYVVVAG